MAKIGIDFGTTNSSLVAYDGDKERFIYLGEGMGQKEPTPSVVWYHDKCIEVGKTAKGSYNTYSNVPGHHLESSVKSKLGTDTKAGIFGKPTDPYIIASEILKKLKKTAAAYGAESSGVDLDRAVFTVPVSFTGRQRADLRKAAAIAGISVETFIHEPFAALVGYLFSEAISGDLSHFNDSYILVFDWGGGTLDITAVKAEDDRLYEVGTGELSGIAGDKFDEELAAFARSKFIDAYSSEFNLETIDIMLRKNKDRILSNAEKCKIALSCESEATMSVEDVFYDEDRKKSYDINVNIKRTDFEAAIKRYIDDASNQIEKTLYRAGISREQISFVLLTGGTSNIPFVRAAIEDKFGSRVKTPDDPELVIAKGAAVVAEKRWSPYLAKNIMAELSDGSFWTVFAKGMPLVRDKMPEKEETFVCTDSRDSEAKLIIAEGKTADTKDKNFYVLNIPVLNPPNLRSGDEIVAKFTIDKDIVLVVKGHGKFAGKRKTGEIHDICFGLEMR